MLSIPGNELEYAAYFGAAAPFGRGWAVSRELLDLQFNVEANLIVAAFRRI
jgi:hypothetical protein